MVEQWWSFRQESREIASQPEAFLKGGAYSPDARVDFLWVLQFTLTEKNMNVRLIDHSDLSLGVKSCFSFLVLWVPVMNVRTF